MSDLRTVNTFSSQEPVIRTTPDQIAAAFGPLKQLTALLGWVSHAIPVLEAVASANAAKAAKTDVLPPAPLVFVSVAVED